MAVLIRDMFLDRPVSFASTLPKLALKTESIEVKTDSANISINSIQSRRRSIIASHGNLGPFFTQTLRARAYSGADGTTSNTEVDNTTLSIRNIESGTRSMLKLVYLLEKALPESNKSVAEWAMSRSAIIGDMLNAMHGNYYYVLQLVATLNNGTQMKHILDSAIDKCDLLNNLRESIIIQRICNMESLTL